MVAPLIPIIASVAGSVLNSGGANKKEGGGGGGIGDMLGGLLGSGQKEETKTAELSQKDLELIKMGMQMAQGGKAVG